MKLSQALNSKARLGVKLASLTKNMHKGISESVYLGNF